MAPSGALARAPQTPGGVANACLWPRGISCWPKLRWGSDRKPICSPPHSAPSGGQEECALTGLPGLAQVAGDCGAPRGLPSRHGQHGRNHRPSPPLSSLRSCSPALLHSWGGRQLPSMGLPGPPRCQLWGGHVRGAVRAGGGVAQAAAGKHTPKGERPRLEDSGVTLGELLCLSFPFYYREEAPRLSL